MSKDLNPEKLVKINFCLEKSTVWQEVTFSVAVAAVECFKLYLDGVVKSPSFGFSKEYVDPKGDKSEQPYLCINFNKVVSVFITEKD